MYTFLTELQSRPDGIINSSVTSRSSLALTLQDADGQIIENRAFETLYEGE